MSEIISGVYLIRCIPTDKVYVGSSANIKARWTQHKRDFTKSQGGCIKLRNAWLKHGTESFTWEILEAVEPDRLIEREQHFIDLFQAADRNRGFNTRRFADSNRGVDRTEEHRAKLSAANKGRSLTPEQDAKRQEGRQHNSPETRAKISASHRNLSPEKKAKIQEARCKPRSQESRARISAAVLARWSSPEHQARRDDLRRVKAEQRAQRAEARREYMQSPEYKAILAERASNQSPEHQAKFLAAAQSPETQAKRTAAVREARKKSEYNYSPEARARMAEGGRKGNRGPQKQQKRRALQKSLEGLKLG